MQKQLEYYLPFKLDETKLTAIVDTAHEHLVGAQHVLLTDRFEVFFSEVDREELNSLDEVLALENSRARRIQRIIVICASALQPSNAMEREIEIDFGAKKRNTSGGRSTVVSINIQSNDAVWARHALSAVEQQVERTWQRYTVAGIWLLVIVAATGVMFFSLSPSMRPSPTVTSSTMWLNGSDLDRAQLLLTKGNVLSEEDSREVLTMQLRNVVRDQTTDSQISPKAERRFYLLAAACLFVLGCAVMLLAMCYPHAVFYWGDGKERYESALTMRGVIWTILRSVTIVAIVGSIFAGIVGSEFFNDK